uniref:Uncharacterized protein n=1 Tax=Anser cygnoides TaxID=8845 RepID=A0A8B9DTH0_ANSCY
GQQQLILGTGAAGPTDYRGQYASLQSEGKKSLNFPCDSRKAQEVTEINRGFGYDRTLPHLLPLLWD